MEKQGEELANLNGSRALLLEELVRRRSDRIKRLSRIYRKRYWALIVEVRFKYREYYWKFGKSGLKQQDSLSSWAKGNHDGEFGFVVLEGIEEDGRGFLGGGGEGGLGVVDRSEDSGSRFSKNGFPASGNGGLLTEAEQDGFGFPGRVLPAKTCGDGSKFESGGEDDEFRHLDTKMGRDLWRFPAGSWKNTSSSQATGFSAVKAEDDRFSFAEGGFRQRMESDGYGYVGNSSENTSAFVGNDFPVNVGYEGHGLLVKASGNGFRDQDGLFNQENSVVRPQSGENGVACPGKAGDEHCEVTGCKLKPMALSSFCRMHILSDSKQQLYTACSYVIKSGQIGAITCGKPVLRAAVPSLCATHFQIAQKHVARSLRKAGHNASPLNNPASKFHVIISAHVGCIQTKRRKAGCRVHHIHNKDSSLAKLQV